MSVTRELVRYAANDPQSMVDDTISEDWYRLMPDTEQAEFWTDMLKVILQRFGAEETADLSTTLDVALPTSTREMLIANVRAFFNRRQDQVS